MSNANTIPHDIKSNAFSSYVVHYHMTREPFADTIEDDLFYAEPGHQQKLDILLHLTQYGNELVLLTGPVGSGKTALLQQYLLKSLDTWVVARVDTQGGIDERKLLQQLFHQTGIDFHGATHSELFERMQHHFDTLQHNAQQAVLLIDNAEQLPVTALKRVLEMAALTSADNKPLLRVILFGTNKLNEIFDDPLLGSQTHVIRRNVELLPFTQEQTTHYILHRLSAANFGADKPFTDTVLQKIHKKSNGWPGEINQLAHNVLIETLPTEDAAPIHAPTFNRFRTAAALAGIILIGMLLFFQDAFNAWFTPEPASIANQPDPASLPVDTQITAIPDAVPTLNVVHKPEAAPQETTDKNADSDIAPASESITPNVAVATTPGTTIQQPVPAAAPLIAEKETKPEPITHPLDTTASLAVNTSPIPDDLPGFRVSWILRQNPEHYTLQLVAGNNIKTLRNYIRQHPLDEPLAIYYTTRKGKPWFGLVQHSYPSKQAALDARRQLPAALRRQKPWVRQFSALQNDLGHPP